MVIEAISEDVLKGLSSQRIKGEFCDVQLTNGVSKLWSHSCVLAAVSPFMMRYFVKHINQVDMSIRQPVQLSISTVTKCCDDSQNNCMDCLSDALDYMYTGKISLSAQHFDHIYNLSNNLELNELSILCQKFKKSNLVFIKEEIKSPAIVNESDNFFDTDVIVTEVETEQGFACDDCGYRTQTDEQFLLHDVTFHHPGYSCLSCAFKVDELPDLVEHLETSLHGSNICSVCLYETPDHIAFVDHLVEHKDPKPFKCIVCRERFVDKISWSKHNISNCANSEYKNNESCNICKYSFPNEDLKKKHMRVFHKNKYTCLSCEYSTYKIDKMVHHLKAINHKENFCSLCVYESKSIIDLQKHLNEHLEKMPFRCSACSSLFPSRRQWWRHMATHFKEKPFKCPSCSFAFKNKVLLNTHELRVHREKKYFCSECGFAAPFYSLLKKHERTHVAKHEYVCPVEGCSYKTKWKKYFVQHKKEHPAVTIKKPENPLECSLCKLTFSLEKNLKRHVKLKHDLLAPKYQCPRCAYSTVRIDKIKHHFINIHCMDVAEANELTSILKVTPEPETLEAETLPNGENLCKNVPIEPSKDLLNSNPAQEKFNDSVKKTLFFNKNTGEINIISGIEGKAIPIASVTSTNLLTIGNFREGTGSVTLNEATGVLTLSNINSESIGAVFLNESTGELSYIDLNSENNEDRSQLAQSDIAQMETTQLDEVTGEIITIESETKEFKMIGEDSINFEDVFDCDLENFNDDSFDGFDDFDELLFENLTSDQFVLNDVKEPDRSPRHFDLPVTPRLDEMTGELTFDETNRSQDIWSDLKPFREVTNDSILENVNNSSYNFLLNEITGEFYK